MRRMTGERTEIPRRTRAPRAEPAEEAVAPRAEPSRPLLVVGLGNPDAQYAGTRHNIGAVCIAVLARRHRVELKREGRVDRARISVDGRELDIARPRSHMNDSGTPIAQELRRLGLRPELLLVIYDDLDLPVGRVRMRLQGSSGGNNGLKSIITALGGATTFPRVRIGIDRPYDGTTPVYDPERIAEWVLSRPHPDDRRRLDAAAERVADAVEEAARDGLEIAMNALNRWTPPEA
ncbi:MAG: aminoacyl-tRNA hydrolase [Dehalococcoidia bacterium]|nr:aminoacyl-tRNA hydrolase [Dehalococcoidia bacterium]